MLPLAALGPMIQGASSVLSSAMSDAPLSQTARSGIGSFSAPLANIGWTVATSGSTARGEATQDFGAMGGGGMAPEGGAGALAPWATLAGLGLAAIVALALVRSARKG